MNEQSIMPNYAWFARKDINLELTPRKIRAMQTLGVPYEEGYDELAVADLMKQAQEIVDDLKKSNIEIEPNTQMVAMIAYMHKLGTGITPPLMEEVEIKTDIALLTAEADLNEGGEIFSKTCVACHGAEGKGFATFPDLTDDEWITGNSPSEVYQSIANGNIPMGMIAYKTQYSEKQITQLTSYVLLILNENEDSK